MNARALEYKEKISSDDAKALKNYGDVSGKNDGNWFSRNLGWLWGKGKTAKAFRANRKERNEYINTYMQDYGVSKKDAKKALNLLSMNNNSTSGTQSAQSNTSLTSGEKAKTPMNITLDGKDYTITQEMIENAVKLPFKKK